MENRKGENFEREKNENSENQEDLGNFGEDKLEDEGKEWIKKLEEQADAIRKGEEIEEEVAKELGEEVVDEVREKKEIEEKIKEEKQELTEEQKDLKDVDNRTKEQKEKDYQEWKEYHKDSGLADVQAIKEIELAKENPILREVLEKGEKPTEKELKELGKKAIEGKIEIEYILEKNKETFDETQERQKREGFNKELIEKQESAQKTVEIILEIEKNKESLLPYLEPEKYIDFLKEINVDIEIERGFDKEKLTEKELKELERNLEKQKEENDGIIRNNESSSGEVKEKNANEDKKEDKAGKGKGGVVLEMLRKLVYLAGYFISSIFVGIAKIFGWKPKEDR